jgi:hypothetical protein
MPVSTSARPAASSSSRQWHAAAGPGRGVERPAVQVMDSRHSPSVFTALAPITRPRLAGQRAVQRVDTSESGPNPRRCRAVAVRSAGDTRPSFGTRPLLSLAPYTAPPFTPPPASADREHVPPVVPPGPGVELRRPPELRQHHHERVVQQPAVGEVVEQRAIGPVGGRGEHRLQPLRLLRVRVPARGVHRLVRPAEPVHVDQLTPASTSRRASRQLCPNCVRP